MIKPVYIMFFLFFIIYACKKEKKCPGFDMKDSIEFCYLLPDTLIFENEVSEKFQVFISRINISEPYTYECREIERVCACINYIEALATDTKNSNQYTFLKMEQSDVSEMQYFKYNVQGFEFEFDFINELPYIDQMDHLTYFNSLKVGNLIYNDVILITNNDLSEANIYQVYFNKQNGVLRFIENSTKKVWNISN